MSDQSYPSDVSDDEWIFVVPYLTLMRDDASQRDHKLRDVFNGLRWIIRSGAPWRLMPHDLPPWEAVYQQSQRWIKWGCFEAIVHDLRVLAREAAGKEAQPTAVIFDGRTVQSSSESGSRAGFDGNKRRKGSKVHLAVDTLGHLLALVVTPANEQERAQVAELCEQERAQVAELCEQERAQVAELCEAVQEVTGQNVEVAFVDQGYSGEDAQEAAKAHGIVLEIVKHPAATKGFVVLPKRWVVERSIAWTARCRRLARDYERLPQTLAGLHFVLFAGIMLAKATAKGYLSHMMNESS